MSAPTLPTVGFRTNAKWNITEGGPVYALYALAPEFLELQLAPDFTIELLKVDVPGQQTTGTVMGGQQSDQSLARGRQRSQRPSRVDLRRDQCSSPSVGRHHDQRIKKNHAIIRVQFKEEITIEGVVYKGARISMDTLEVEKWSEEDIKNRFMLHWQCEHAIDDAQKPCEGSHKSSVSDANFRLLEDLEPKDGNAIILTLGTILSLPIDHKMDYFLFRYIKSKATATANPLARCQDFVLQYWLILLTNGWIRHRNATNLKKKDLSQWLQYFYSKDKNSDKVTQQSKLISPGEFIHFKFEREMNDEIYKVYDWSELGAKGT